VPAVPVIELGFLVEVFNLGAGLGPEAVTPILTVAVRGRGLPRAEGRGQANQTDRPNQIHFHLRFITQILLNKKNGKLRHGFSGSEVVQKKNHSDTGGLTTARFWTVRAHHTL